MVMKLLADFKKWKHKRFLKKHGCETQREFDKKFDSLINPYADTIKNYYKGYQYYYVFYSTQDSPWHIFGDWLEGLTVVNEWCEKNCQGKWRFDIHRVLRQTGIGLDDTTEVTWFFNELGGRDRLFFAFTDHKDLMLFTLRWS